MRGMISGQVKFTSPPRCSIHSQSTLGLQCLTEPIKSQWCCRRLNWESLSEYFVLFLLIPFNWIDQSWILDKSINIEFLSFWSYYGYLSILKKHNILRFLVGNTQHSLVGGPQICILQFLGNSFYFSNCFQENLLFCDDNIGQYTTFVSWWLTIGAQFHELTQLSRPNLDL